MALSSQIGEYFGKTLVLEQWGYENLVEFPAGITYMRYRVPAGFLPVVSSLGSWRPSED